MSNQPVIKALEKALADSYVLYIKTQNFHWNVKGHHFSSLHTLFEQQYTDLAAAADEIAERIRALGASAPGSMQAFLDLTCIKESGSDLTADKMVKALADDQTKIVATMKAALEAAQKSDDEVTADLMIGRMTIHEKNRWMLNSSI